MKLKLKYWILLLLCLVVLGLGIIIPRQATSSSIDPKIVHILNQTSFGIAPGDIKKVQSLGIQGYLQSQLNPDSIPEPPKLTQELSQLKTLPMSAVELYREYAPMRQGNAKKPDRQTKKPNSENVLAEARRRRQVGQEAIEANLLRAIYSPRQLQEVMANFWYNHFNVFIGKNITRLWVGDYEEVAIRPHVFGRFRDLLEATSRHAAMLMYLDNWENTAPDSKGARGRFKGINENYARELMELHTLGVDGGYSQQDVTTLARILTGWGLDRQGNMGGDENGFYFDASRHDFSDKVFLGKTIKGSGAGEVEQALDILARHPSTARHISYQLAQYFVADKPPTGLVQRLSQRFLETDGDIRAVLETMFQSPEFLDPKYYDTKFKTPYEYIISLVRATGTDNPNLKVVFAMMNQLGMAPYNCLTPDGYKNTEDVWLNPDAILRRLSFATSVASGRLDGGESLDAVKLAQTLGNSFSTHTQDVLNQTPPKLRAALILGSPEMMRR